MQTIDDSQKLEYPPNLNPHLRISVNSVKVSNIAQLAVFLFILPF